jgi:DNA modification methylase
MKAVFGGRNKHEGYGTRLHSGREDQGNYIQNGVNKRSVWTVATQPYKGAHFATFPTKLIEPCVLAGCPKGGTVLDPFSGSGTTGVVSLSNERNYIGIELNPEYVELSHTRIQKAVPLFITQSIQKMDELEEVAS